MWGVAAWGITRRGGVATRRGIATGRRGVPWWCAAKSRRGRTSIAPTSIVRRRSGRCAITADTLSICASVAVRTPPVRRRGLPIAAAERAIRWHTTVRRRGAVSTGRDGMTTIGLLRGRPAAVRRGAPAAPLVRAPASTVVGHGRRPWLLSPR